MQGACEYCSRENLKLGNYTIMTKGPTFMRGQNKASTRT